MPYQLCNQHNYITLTIFCQNDVYGTLKIDAPPLFDVIQQYNFANR